jgi:hypothetical protein
MSDTHNNRNSNSNNSNNNNSNNNSNSNNNNVPPRKKRKWYRENNTKNNIPPAAPPTAPPESRQDILKARERERIENEKQVSNMEQQLHEFFHKSKTPYSFVDETGIYKFTPATAPAPAPAPAPVPAFASVPLAPVVPNPFMNMTFTPFIPSNAHTLSLFSSMPPVQTNLWAPMFPNKMTEPTAPVAPRVVPEMIEIRENIQHIDDLIALCDKYPLSDTKKYNINMAAIHAIRDPLRDLSSMIGMDTIKQTIVDQILYYLQELHIPENKNTSAAKAAETVREQTPYNEVNNIFNPFASPFTASESAPVTNPIFDFKTLNQRISENMKKAQLPEDNGSSPTKGDFMHTVIYGPPGSGKTEVAKIIGRIFSNLGILNKKIFKKVSRNDLVAGYLGQTAIKTKDMIKASLGGVLFIDEAYSLGNSEKRDSFAKECVDTLCEALSEHKHNWMVIIAGYEKELNDCFFALNEGLNSRFTWRFKLDGYKPGELKSIYEKQVRDYGWTIAATTATAAAAATATETVPESWFASRMEYFTTYGRDMETLFTKTKIAHSRRVFCLPVCEKKIVTFSDLENGFKLFIENPEVKERKERGSGPYMKTLYL